MTALATQADLTRFGYPTPENADALLLRASARVRLAAGHQNVNAGQSTVTLPIPRHESSVRLWQFPVTSVDSVTLDDGAALTSDDYQLVGQELFLYRHARWCRSVTVTYSYGWTTPPDELVELVCSVATRLSGTRPDRDPAIQAKTVGDVSETYNPAALDTVSGLLPGEEATLRRIFYRRG